VLSAHWPSKQGGCALPVGSRNAGGRACHVAVLNALELPSFNSLLYTVDVLLPFIDLGFST